jgi:hypothetical protein
MTSWVGLMIAEVNFGIVTPLPANINGEKAAAGREARRTLAAPGGGFLFYELTAPNVRVYYNRLEEEVWRHPIVLRNWLKNSNA